MKNRDTATATPLSVTLPSPLIDRRSAVDDWGTFQDLLNINKNLIKKAAEAKINKEYICPITGSLMHSPMRVLYSGKSILIEGDVITFLKAVIANKVNSSEYRNSADLCSDLCREFPYLQNIADLVVLLIEDERSQSTKGKVKINFDVHMRNVIHGLIKYQKHLRKLQYLPFSFLKNMNHACREGDQVEMKRLIKNNYRILVTPDSITDCLPLHQAVVNESSFDFLLNQFDKIKSGLALAALLHPNKEGELPLEYALRTGNSEWLVLKIMAWMGKSLDTFELTATLSEERKPFLNNLLLICILQGNLEWTNKLISWGADIYGSVSEDSAILDRALQLANPRIKNALFEKANMAPLRMVEKYDKGVTSHHPLSIQFDHESAPLEKCDLRTQLKNFKTIKAILNVISNYQVNTFDSIHACSPCEEQKKVIVSKTAQVNQALSKPHAELLQDMSSYDIGDFINAVISEDQLLVELILNENPQLAKQTGELPGTGLPITGFQYAYSVGDNEMYAIIAKYLLPEELTPQLDSINYQTLKQITAFAQNRKEQVKRVAGQITFAEGCSEQAEFQESPSEQKHFQSYVPEGKEFDRLVDQELRSMRSMNLAEPQPQQSVQLSGNQYVFLPAKPKPIVQRTTVRVMEPNTKRSGFFQNNPAYFAQFWSAVFCQQLGALDEMLHRDHGLLHILGNIAKPTSHGLSYTRMTVYQYALLNNDVAMQNIILRFLDKHQAATQRQNLNLCIQEGRNTTQASYVCKR